MSSEIRFEVVKDLDHAHKLWDLFTPRETIYDDWDFRYCFYKYFNYELFFYVGYVGGEPVGLLPLEYNSEKKKLEFFGTYFMETNQVFIKSGFEQHIPDFYKAIKNPAHLEYISGQDEFTKKLPLQDYKYILEIQDFSTFDEYVQKRFSSKSRGVLKKKIRAIEEGRKIELIFNQADDLELLFELSIKTFAEKGDVSSFTFPFRKDIYRSLLELPYEKELITFMIDGVKQVVSLSLIYNGWYVFLNLGGNLHDFQNLGTYLYSQMIERAFARKLKYFDAGVVAYNWKERFHLTQVPQYQFDY